MSSDPGLLETLTNVSIIAVAVRLVFWDTVGAIGRFIDKVWKGPNRRIEELEDKMRDMESKAAEDVEGSKTNGPSR